MADPQRPWSNDEKNFLLAEIIKQQSPNPGVLLSVAANIQAIPKWDDMALPPGRTVNQCRFAYDELRLTTQPVQLPSFIPGPYTPLSAPPVGLKRPFQGFEGPFIAGREIRPKPVAVAGATSRASPNEPPSKRKRGRPTKAQQAAKAAAEAAMTGRAEAGPAPRPATPAQAQTTAQSVIAASMAPAAPMEESRPTLQAPARMQISAVLTPTNPNTASSSSSSSGRRRRGRSQRSGADAPGEGIEGSGQQYQSPYGRAAEPLEDTPARAAVLRHREEQQQASQQAPQSEPIEFGIGQASDPPVSGPPASGSP